MNKLIKESLVSKIKSAIIGTGYISGFHIDAIRRTGIAEVLALSDINNELAQKKAQEYSVPKYYRYLDELLADEDIDVIHNCTPNNLHFKINKKIIESKKHVFSEKPLALSSDESYSLVNLIKKNPKIVGGVNFNYRMNPLVQEMRYKVKKGDIGKPLLVHGSYLQDWLLFDTDYNWRVNSKIGGNSRCIADIGSHWIDLAQTILEDRIEEVCADLATIHKTRKRPTTQVETFSLSKDIEYENEEIDTEDYGSVMFRMKSGIHGVFYASQVSAGRKCFLNIEIDGSKSSMYWNQELADWMWIGNRDKANFQIMRNPNLMTNEAKKYTVLAAGHPEGWNDAEKNNIQSFYKYIIDGKEMGKDHQDFASFEEASYILKVVEAILESDKEKKWKKVDLMN